MSAAWHRYDAVARRLTLTLHVQPGARKSGIAGTHGDALKIRIAAPAVDNKANAALIGFLSDTLDIPISTITICHGATGRRKVVEIVGSEELAAKVEMLVGQSTTHNPRSTPATSR
jgi:uncharacterized protein (TIGR00251 family)